MNKKKHFAFDAIHFGFKMLRKHFYFLFMLFSAASLLFVGIVILVCYIKCEPITQNIFKAITTALNYFMTEKTTGITEELEKLELTRFIRLFIPLFASIYLIICHMIGSVLSIALYDDKNISFKKTVSIFRKVPSYLGVITLYYLVIFIGYYFFIIPGLLMEIRLRLCNFFIIDNNASVMQSLKGSWHISKGHLFDIFISSIMGRSIVVIGGMINNGLYELIANDIISVVIMCYITLICLFINTCALAFLYRKLLEEKQMQLKTISIINEGCNQLLAPMQENA